MEYKMTIKALKIAIYCCNNLTGEGIKHLIEADGLRLRATINCATPEEIIKAKPDLLIADFSTLYMLPIDSIYRNKIEVLILWSHWMPGIEDERLTSFVFKGVVGILPPDINPSQFTNAIKKAVSGELLFDRKKLKDIIYSMKNDRVQPSISLTKTEIEVVKLICKGYRNKEIMRKLHIKEQSVKKHLNRIYKKAGVSDRLQLALHALKYWPNLG